MHIDVYSTMHNEAVLLPWWLRHYSGLASRLFIWEEDSTDGTREMLEAHPMVQVMPVSSHGIDDLAWVRTLWSQYPRISRGIADWVIIVDCDEFIYHPDLHGQLAQHRAAGDRILKLDGYNMVADAPPTTAQPIYEEIRTGFRDSFWLHKPCCFDPTVSLTFQPGRHSIHHSAANAPIIESPIALLHYRYLGDAYCAARNARNRARMSARNIKLKYHKTYRPQATAQTPHSLPWYQQHRQRAYDVISEIR